MRLGTASLFLALTILLLSSAPAVAGDPAFSYGKQEDVKDVDKVIWTAKAEAGLVSTSGNSRTTTATASANATRKDKDNKLDLQASGTYARASVLVVNDANGDKLIQPEELDRQTSTSAENAAAKLRYDRYLTTLNSLYVALLAGFDKPAGKAFQGGAQAGYSRSIYKTDKAEATVEIGYDLSYLRLVDDGSTTIHSARVFAGWKGKVSDDVAVEASSEGLFNLNTITIGDTEAGAFKDTRINTLLGLTAALSSKISCSVSFTVKYDNVPAPLAPIGGLMFDPTFPLPHADKTDTILKASLIVTLL
jgi:Protein of unknown function, DUF481